MHVTNFVSKIDKKMYLEGQFQQLNNHKWLYCKIETLRGQYANDPNPRRWLCNLAFFLIRVQRQILPVGMWDGWA